MAKHGPERDEITVIGPPLCALICDAQLWW
jgi:hypothetical protein